MKNETASTKTSSSQDESQIGGMVVGIDGSAGSKRALDWAANRVDRFGPIRPAASWNFPWWGMTVSPLPGAVPPSVLEYEEHARFEAEKALEQVPPELQEPLILKWSSPGRMLCEVGKDANLIVVGTRGRTAIPDAFLGSTSSYVASHTTCPVAVVPEQAPIHQPNGQVVVGLDGSVNSMAAFAWALENTSAADELVVVHTWNFSTANPTGENVPRTRENLGKQARQNLSQWVGQVLSEKDEIGDRKITQLVEYGDPRLVLQSLSADADLLVIGARGHRGVAHLLLGSVATSILHHPFTTIVVVPTRKDRE